MKNKLSQSSKNIINIILSCILGGIAAASMYILMFKPNLMLAIGSFICLWSSGYLMCKGVNSVPKG